MNDIEITLLSVDDLFVDDDKETKPLEVLKKYGRDAYPTDLAILTFGYVSESNMTNYSNTGMRYWTKNKSENMEPEESENVRYVQVISESGKVVLNQLAFQRIFGIRPVLIPSKNLFLEIISYRKKITDGLYTVQYGEYPQNAPDSYMQEELENEYTSGNLKKTGKTYTFDKARSYDDFEKVIYEEYEYYGRKYIRIKASPYHYTCRLSNRKKYKRNEYVWLEVSPVKWLIDFENNKLISKNCLLAGVRYHENIDFENFEETEMYNYLKTYMLKDMISEDIKQLIQINLSSNEISSYEEKLLEDETLSKEELEALQKAFEDLKGSNPKRR